MKTTLSIVTPSYNQGRFIERTIQSILSQSVPPSEYVIFDGGSTDNTIDILKKYENRLRWTSEKDRGQTHAVNKGITATSGDVIGWINSDDIYYPGAFEAVLEYFESHPKTDVIFGNANHIDENDQVIEPYYTEEWNYERLLDICFLCQPAVFFRRRCVEKFGLLDETLRYCMDYEYWLRLGAKTDFHYLQKTLAGSRMYNDNKTIGARVAVHDEMGRMLRKRLGKTPIRWVFNYAHAVTDELGYDRTDPWQNICYCCSLVIESSKKFIQWNGKIPMGAMRTMAEWLLGAAGGFLKR